MTKVGIVTGSGSDTPVMAQVADILGRLGVEFEMTVISTRREPDTFFNYAKSLEGRGVEVVITGTRKAIHLPDTCTALFPMPVVGIPMKASDLGGVDSLYSIVQMPSGILVAIVTINGGTSAGTLAAKTLATPDSELLERLEAYSEGLESGMVKKMGKLDEADYKKYVARTKKQAG